MSTWAIVLIAIAVVLLLAIIIGILIKARSSGIGFFEVLGEGISDVFGGCSGGGGDWDGGVALYLTNY